MIVVLLRQLQPRLSLEGETNTSYGDEYTKWGTSLLLNYAQVIRESNQLLLQYSDNMPHTMLLFV